MLSDNFSVKLILWVVRRDSNFSRALNSWIMELRFMVRASFMECRLRPLVVGLPVYGINRGTVGFLLNPLAGTALPAKIAQAKSVSIHPLEMGVNPNRRARSGRMGPWADKL